VPRLKDKVVVVTGGAQGIGRAFCEGLAKEGAKVVVADIDQGKADATALALQKQGAEVIAVAVDVASESSAAQMIGGTLSRFGRIDGLINNAAMFQRPAVKRGPFWELGADDWDRVMAVNVRGTWLCAKLASEPMRKQRSGSIVNISSGTVHAGAPNFAHYVTSKAAVIGLTRVMSRELGDYDIRVNAIAPGLTLSIEADEARVAQHKNFAMMRSIKRIQAPEDLVGAVIFFISEDSAFVTGQTLLVDGGASMT